MGGDREYIGEVELVSMYVEEEEEQEQEQEQEQEG